MLSCNVAGDHCPSRRIRPTGVLGEALRVPEGEQDTSQQRASLFIGYPPAGVASKVKLSFLPRGFFAFRVLAQSPVRRVLAIRDSVGKPLTDGPDEALGAEHRGRRHRLQGGTRGNGSALARARQPEGCWLRLTPIPVTIFLRLFFAVKSARKYSALTVRNRDERQGDEDARMRAVLSLFVSLHSSCNLVIRGHHPK